MGVLTGTGRATSQGLPALLSQVISLTKEGLDQILEPSQF